MEFIDELNNYKQQRESEILGKQILLTKLQLDYKNVLYQVKASKEKYKLSKLSFSDSTFESLTKLQTQAEYLKYQIELAKIQVSLMDIGNYKLDKIEVTSQVKEFVGLFQLEKLKKNILQKKADYLNSFKIYSETLQKIEAARLQLDNLEPVIVEADKVPILRAFYNPKYYLDAECDISPCELVSLKSNINTILYSIGKDFENRI